MNDARPQLSQPSPHTAAASESGAAVGDEISDGREEEYFDDWKEHGGKEEETVMEMCAICDGTLRYWMQYKGDAVEEIDVARLFPGYLSSERYPENSLDTGLQRIVWSLSITSVRSTGTK